MLTAQSCVTARARRALLAVALGSAALLGPVAGQTAQLYGQTFQGNGTYYGDAAGAGTCSFQYSDAVYLPWAAGTQGRVAINSAQFFGSQSCGTCLAIRGTGPGSGGTPISQTTQYVLVSNQCPECQKGDLDIEKAGDGRWQIEWFPVQCAVGSSSFYYSFQGSNSYYIKMTVVNARVPVSLVEWSVRGTYYPMDRTGDNYFTLGAVNGQTLTLPAKIRLTSIFGDVVTDTVPGSSPMGRVPGSAQFPPNPSYGSVPPPGSAPPPSPPSASPAVSTVAPAPAPVAPNPAPAPPAPAPAVPAPAPAAPAPAPTAPAAAPSAPAPSPADPAPPAPAPAPMAPAPAPSAPAPAPAPVAPAPAPSAPAPAPTASPTQASAPDASQAAKAQPVPTPAATTALAPCQSSTPPPPAPTCNTVIPAWGQCGGLNSAPSAAQAGDHVWPGTQCTAGYICVSNNNPWYYQCVPEPKKASGQSFLTLRPNVNKGATFLGLVQSSVPYLTLQSMRRPSNCTFYVEPFGQCGGSAGACYSDQCQDAAFPGYCCAPDHKGQSFACARTSSQFWQCVHSEYAGAYESSPQPWQKGLPITSAAATSWTATGPRSPMLLAGAAPLAKSADSLSPPALAASSGTQASLFPSSLDLSEPSSWGSRALRTLLASRAGSGNTAKAEQDSANCTAHVDPYAQCGGTGGDCGSNCTDGPFPGACCSPDITGQLFSCQRTTTTLFQCLVTPLNDTDFPAQAPVPSALAPPASTTPVGAAPSPSSVQAPSGMPASLSPAAAPLPEPASPPLSPSAIPPASPPVPTAGTPLASPPITPAGTPPASPPVAASPSLPAAPPVSQAPGPQPAAPTQPPAPAPAPSEMPAAEPGAASQGTEAPQASAAPPADLPVAAPSADQGPPQATPSVSQLPSSAGNPASGLPGSLGSATPAAPSAAPSGAPTGSPAAGPSPSSPPSVYNPFAPVDSRPWPGLPGDMGGLPTEGLTFPPYGSSSGALPVNSNFSSISVANLTVAETTLRVIANITSTLPLSCGVIVAPGDQCGGQGGTCEGTECVDAAWDGACCVSPLNKCFRYDATYWECRLYAFSDASA